MSEAENLFGEEHIRRYRETDGEVGHIWRRGAKILLLTTTGRKTGEQHTVPLIYEKAGDRYVIVASKGGAPEHPGWYRNLAKDPEVELQVMGERFPARARTASGDEREQLWKLAAQQWPDYDEYQTRTDREIPVVVLEPERAARRQTLLAARNEAVAVRPQRLEPQSHEHPARRDRHAEPRRRPSAIQLLRVVTPRLQHVARHAKRPVRERDDAATTNGHDRYAVEHAHLHGSAPAVELRACPDRRATPLTPARHA